MTHKTSGQSLHGTSCISQRTPRDEWSDESRVRPHNSDAIGRVENYAERTRIRLSRYLKRYKQSIRRTAHYSGSPIRFYSAGLGLQCEWRIERLANPCTERHVSRKERHATSDPTKVGCPHDNSDATERVENYAERAWIRLSGYLKTYKRNVRRTAHYSGSPIRFYSARLGLQCEWRLRRMANPCTERHVYRKERHATSDPTKVRSVLTTTATRLDASRTTRSDQHGLDCQDICRGMKGASVEPHTTQAVRFGSIRLDSGYSANDA